MSRIPKTPPRSTKPRAGFKIFFDRHGHHRCYHRKAGIAIDLKKAPLDSPEFIAESARIKALVAVAP
jgi:hypothetical protein